MLCREVLDPTRQRMGYSGDKAPREDAVTGRWRNTVPHRIGVKFEKTSPKKASA